MKWNNIEWTGARGGGTTFSVSTLGGGWNSGGGGGGCVDSSSHCVKEKMKSVPPMNHVLKEMQEKFGHRKFRMGQVWT